ncbi:ATP-binding protein [Flavobacterium sp. NRK1]|uniref:ATP-binding protein n=1 Tax=Flavobacterium sp. NRK1 TaxID=2954929 RepID=UPI0020923EC6|nr:ATP-binding protein [Flavobacterium sp. NRK1]MCO6147907.1 ATP-binding protein [Flavobacterium sp. NRK1]
MKLLYCKIFEKPGKQLQIANIDLNFSGQYTFSVDNTSKAISCLKNENYINNLYGNNTNITAIVGKNGLGKTTFLKFLQYVIGSIQETENIPNYDFTWWNWCAVYSQNNKLYYCENIVSKAIDKQPPEHDLFDLYSYADTFEIKKEEIEIDLNTIDLTSKCSFSIYYSPFFEFEEIRFDRLGYVDVSNDMLFYESNNRKEVDDQALSQTLNFKREEVKRQISFVEQADSVLENKDQFYSDFIHNEISLSFNGLTKKFSSDPRYISFDDVRLYNEIDKAFIKSHRATRDYLRGKTVRDYEYFIARDSFFKRILELIYFLFEYRPDPKENSQGEFRQSIIGISLEEKDYDKNLNELNTIFFDNLVVVRHKEKFGEAVNKALQLINLFKSYDVNDDTFSYDLATAKELLKVELEILSLMPFKSDLPVFTFDWKGLSTGEKAYLNLFSRIYYGYQQIKDDVEFAELDHIYILIDEGSTGFHPQWQKEFLTHLLKFSEEVIPVEKSFIITSHSPYLLSDLQIEDTISIGREPSSKFPLNNTFAANIHELLADKFYLSNSFIGDFSRQKIEEIGNLLTSDQDVDEEKLNYFERVIEIIGEPIIKERLQFLLAKKRNVKDKDQIIQELREQLEKYRNRE